MCRLICLPILGFAVLMAVPVSVIAASRVAGTGSGHAGCEHAAPRQCVALPITAMGGADKLADIHNGQLEIIEHRSIAEQSYRQAPFLTAYPTTWIEERNNLPWRSSQVLDATFNAKLCSLMEVFRARG